MRKTTVATGALATLAFLGLSFVYRGFVLDDSFITYRYASNLALHGELTWNLGEDPVEGFTSMLWVLLNAGAIALGGDPVVFSKALSVLVAIFMLWVLVAAADEAPATYTAVIAGAIAFSGPFALLTMQGMETTTTAGLVLLAALQSYRLTSRCEGRGALLLMAAFFLCLLCRPDTLLFSFGVGLALLILYLARKDSAAVKRLLAATVVFAVVVAGYVGWRYSFFGYLFPNTFYIKLSNDTALFKGSGLWYLGDFLLVKALPYILLAVVLAFAGLTREKLARVFPIALGCLFFLGYITTIEPIQGFCWRYIFPVYPAFLLALALSFSDCAGSCFPFRRPMLGIGVLLLVALWPQMRFQWTLDILENRTQDDRVAAGKALAGLPGALFTTESGALPYYSGWKAVDRLGLNSERIAHEGLSMKVLEELEPDLIMVTSSNAPGFNERENKVQNGYMRENDFVAVAATHHSLGRWHYYFLRRDSRVFEGAARRLLKLPGARQGEELKPMIRDKRIEVFVPGK